MNIVILGGGTAGWLAALFIAKNNPDHNVTTIASSQIGVLGAGEGVTGELMDVITGRYGDLGIDPQDFLKETNAMPKYGILHKGWTPEIQKSYFAPIDGTPTSLHIPDGVFTYVTATDPDNLHKTTFFGSLLDSDVSPISKITNTTDISTYAFHIDARLTAKYLEKTALKSANCSLIDSKVVDVILDNDTGLVSSLKLETGENIAGDFFIDSSGFSRVIMNKLEAKWVSYKKHLPVNAAIPFFLDYEENEKPKFYSVAHAQSSGWYWEAGTTERKGAGYVYCDDFISKDQAHAEIEKTLGRKIEPLTHFKFNTGRLENVWIKNCLAIGLCGAFAEPLEATSIHATIKQLAQFNFEFLKPTLDDTLNPAAIKFYNAKIARMYDDYKDFLVSHYLGGRKDSDFWQHITNGNTTTEFAEDLKEMCKTRVPTAYDFPGYSGAAGWQIWCHILVGTNQLTKHTAQKHLTKDMIKDAEYLLNELTHGIQKLKLTHFSIDEYLKVISQLNNVPFIRWKGERSHIPNVY
jgi:hypothetical protein